MINAAIVGLGWWGKTLVEAVQQDSDEIRFVAGTTRTKTPEVQAFADAQKFALADTYEALLANPKVDAVVLATPHSMHAAQVIAAAAAGKHIFCEKPFALTKESAEQAVNAAKNAGVTLGLGYNRRFHPEMTKLRARIRIRRSRHHSARRSDHDVSERAAAQARRLESEPSRDSVRRTHADGRSRDRRHDRPVRSHRSRIRAEFPARCPGRRRRHDLHPFPDERRHVGLSGHDDRDRTGIQLSGVRLKRVGAARRHDPRGRAPPPRSAARGCSGPANSNPSKDRRRLGRPSGSTSRALRSTPLPGGAGRPAYPIPTDEMIHGVAVTEAIVRSASSGTVEKI